jgi:hypothetical protein
MSGGDLVAVILSTGAILIGCFGNEFFYAKGVSSVSASNKRAPAAIGRIIFISVGAIGLIIEITKLFSADN